MIVLDGSAVVELVLGSDRGVLVTQRAADAGLVHVPHLASVEAASALRRLVLLGQLEAHRAAGALEDLAELRAVRHPHESLLARAWFLRDNLTMYDAVYVVLASAIGVPLLTCDERLARAPLPADVTVELI